MSVPFFAKRFVAGITLSDVTPVVKELNAQKVQVSLDILGENVATREEAKKALMDYKAVVDSIRQENLQSHISIKLTMLGLDDSDRFAEEQLYELLKHAKEAGTFVRIDMEGSAYTARTVDIFLRARPKFDNVGIVLQAYLKRTEDDLERVLAVNGRVRLCKGAYKEPSSIALQNMTEIRANYMKLARRLFEKCEYPAIATHDEALIQECKALAASSGRKKETFEFQMLYGLRRKSWFRTVGEGYNMRVYVPFGTTWYPYFSRRLRERKENVLFVLTNLFKD